jgi:hypothetical protein
MFNIFILFCYVITQKIETMDYFNSASTWIETPKQALLCRTVVDLGLCRIIPHFHPLGLVETEKKPLRLLFECELK